MNYKRKFAELNGMINEVACKAKIYRSIVVENPHRMGEMQEKLRFLRDDLNRYEKEAKDIGFI